MRRKMRVMVFLLVPGLGGWLERDQREVIGERRDFCLSAGFPGFSEICLLAVFALHVPRACFPSDSRLTPIRIFGIGPAEGNAIK